MKISENSKLVLEERYLLKNKEGQVVESPEGMLRRVAHAVAHVEKQDRAKWAEAFFEMMDERRFLPNSPTLMNAGKDGGQLSACYVLPIQDSLESIFETLKHAAKIHQSGGGTGFSFSQIRPKGSRVSSTHGVASGPVSFLRIFDTATETIKQGGTRRGANMAILRVDHPDIFDFIHLKLKPDIMANFNLSVGVTHKFMHAVKSNDDFGLIDPHRRKEIRRVKAREIFNRMVQSAWASGDPGIVFLDRINHFNPTPALGRMESTNPCGEQPLLPYESCNLGSLNLGSYFKKELEDQFDWKKFERDIRLAVRFLDNVIDLNRFPILKCEKITRANRKIGLGVMGLADLFLMKGSSYSSAEALELGERLMSFLDRTAKQESAKLGEERGEFPNWNNSLWNKMGYLPMRNATVSTVAPTGSISLIAGASSGIEPIFSSVFYRNILGGKRLKEIHPAVEKVCLEKKILLSDVNDQSLEKELGKVWSPGHRVPVSSHVQMQARFQRHSDSAVSKTINLPELATPADVFSAYWMAFESGCKGITVYRDRSKSTQVLEICPEC